MSAAPKLKLSPSASSPPAICGGSESFLALKLTSRSLQLLADSAPADSVEDDAESMVVDVEEDAKCNDTVINLLLRQRQTYRVQSQVQHKGITTIEGV